MAGPLWSNQGYWLKVFSWWKGAAMEKYTVFMEIIGKYVTSVKIYVGQKFVWQVTTVLQETEHAWTRVNALGACHAKIGPGRPIFACQNWSDPTRTNFVCKKWSGCINFQVTVPCLVNFSAHAYIHCIVQHVVHVGYGRSVANLHVCPCVWSRWSR